MHLYSIVTHDTKGRGGQFNIWAEDPLAAIARAAKYYADRGMKILPVTVVHDLTDIGAPSYYPDKDMPTVGRA